ncbi:efflux RND transporter periplasmic adaptor subunit [Aliidiomarina haloalkalitolerans]|uniref:Efflux RND transporter periplasmic adaptor subunit n=1 Tax=Aliidiomarina haloalkalitolerans TaxID=859059 RepID=A0A432VVW8_9GAMM|nr:efflux RND transporter periplasmic adaptor subunit [Aliidiomarina haloalkalitolerans]RUO20737.1 efflux RND transporter periplasmic adaptor subunit [Aliidiomarina haloalkalitolerans]
MKRTRIAIIVAAFLGLALIFVWLAGGFVSKLPTETVSAGTQAESIDSAEVIAARVPQFRNFSGSLQARQQSSISARITARVAEVLVDAGDIVQAGDILLRLESDDLSARVRQQEQSLAAAQARVNEARLNFQRTESVVQQGVLPEARLDEARAARDSAEAELNRAREALSEARTSEGFSVIMAPFDGVISRRAVFTGDTATPGMLLVSVYQPESLRLEAAVSESVLANVRIGDELTMNLDAFSDPFSARVVEIEPAADVASRSFIVRLAPNSTAAMYPGMYGKVAVPAGERDVLLVPAAAVLQVGQLYYVQVVTSSGSERRLVRLGEATRWQGRDYIEVVSGLRDGERVALRR